MLTQQRSRLGAIIVMSVLCGVCIGATTQTAEGEPGLVKNAPDGHRPRSDASKGGPRQMRPGENTDPQKYSLEQAVSDNAQLHTIAFNGLAFLTGDFGASTFMPPGKVCDFFGFQYMRDIDAAHAGHNPKFLNRVAGNVVRTLNNDQKKLFLDLATEQAPKMEQLAQMRLPVIKAFHRQLDGTIPTGSSGLSREAVIKAVGDLFASDAELSYRRAQVMAQVARSLTPEQKAYLAKMKFGDFNSWPDADEREALREQGRGQSKMFNVAYMTYASEFFSWYAGSVDADTYFCPERHGTYFGGFYMKDMPAMGKRDFNISTSVTGDNGAAFLETLSENQRSLVTGIIGNQRKQLQEIIEVRRAISTELREFLAGGQADKAKVIALGRRYGELDGDVSWQYATAFAGVARTLTREQRQTLAKLRNLPGYTSAPYYMYSQPMQEPPNLPNTDLFFTQSGNEKKS